MLRMFLTTSYHDIYEVIILEVFFVNDIKKYKSINSDAIIISHLAKTKFHGCYRLKSPPS